MRSKETIFPIFLTVHYYYTSARRHNMHAGRVSNLSSPDTYNRRLLHEAQDNFAQN